MTTEKLERIVDAFIWGGLEIAEKMPFRPLRFIGVLVAYFFMLITTPIWIPLALLVGFFDIWNGVKDRKI